MATLWEYDYSSDP